jgi:hypothetical protein
MTVYKVSNRLVEANNELGAIKKAIDSGLFKDVIAIHNCQDIYILDFNLLYDKEIALFIVGEHDVSSVEYKLAKKLKTDNRFKLCFENRYWRNGVDKYVAVYFKLVRQDYSDKEKKEILLLLKRSHRSFIKNIKLKEVKTI